MAQSSNAKCCLYRLGKALTYSDTAIKLDDKYAPAWALRASVQNMMAQFGLIDIAEGYRKAHDDAERAIALDPMRCCWHCSTHTR